MKFLTETGSIYEVDLEAKKARRLSGSKEPTKRQGADNLWREYKEVSAIQVGSSVVFSWDPALLPDSPEGAIPATMTSSVVQIFDSENHSLN